MPYRRLPNTDSARIRAMKTALLMCERAKQYELPFEFSLFQKLESFLPHYEMAIKNQKDSFVDQSKHSKSYIESQKKTRLYVSHFIQVLNFSIIRGEMKEEVREFYGIEKDDKTVPSLIQDTEIITWGDKLIKGEQTRTQNGGNPIYSPSIAIVRVNLDKFKTAYNQQKILQNNSHRFTIKVSEMREQADNLILRLWNNIESSFSSIENIDQKRKSCSNYGLVYVYRKTEKVSIAKELKLSF